MPKRGFEPLASPAANHYTTIDLQQNWKQYITARLYVFLKSVIRSLLSPGDCLMIFSDWLLHPLLFIKRQLQQHVYVARRWLVERGPDQ